MTPCMLQTQRSTSSLPYAFIMCTATHLSDHNQVELQQKVRKDFTIMEKASPAPRTFN